MWVDGWMGKGKIKDEVKASAKIALQQRFSTLDMQAPGGDAKCCGGTPKTFYFNV